MRCPISCKESIKVNPERQRKRFVPEFNREAVLLLEQGRNLAAQLALELKTSGVYHRICTVARPGRVSLG